MSDPNRFEFPTALPRDARELGGLQERDFAAALLAVGGTVDAATAARTQRRVRERLNRMAERRQRMRRRIGLAILGFSLLLLAMTPVVWSVFHMQVEEGWQGFVGSDMQSMYVLGWFIPVTMFGLILACLGMRAGRGTRRTDRRSGARLDSARLDSMVR